MAGINPLSVLQAASHLAPDAKAATDAVKDVLPLLQSQAASPRTGKPPSLSTLAAIGKDAHKAGAAGDLKPAFADIRQEGRFLKATVKSLAHGRMKEAGLNYRMAFHHGAQAMGHLANAMAKVPLEAPLAAVVQGVAVAAGAVDHALPSSEKTMAKLAETSPTAHEEPLPAYSASTPPDHTLLLTALSML